jgi:hypothetical protein
LTKNKLAKQFTEMINTYNEHREPWDDRLKLEIAEQQLAILKNPRKVNYRGAYFSPSSAGSCPRELYLKLRKAKKDNDLKPNHQTQWQKLGTAIGDIVQRDLLFIEKHYAKLTGEQPAFVPARTSEGYPFWEEYAQAQVEIEHNGESFKLIGQPDGKLVHTETGEFVGLEIKSKQTKNGVSKVTKPDPKHVKQCVIYSIMYGVDKYIITYVSAVKDNWGESKPVVKAFDVDIAEADRNELLDYFADLVRRARENDPPKMDLNGFTFNNFKRAMALDLTDEEVDEVKAKVRQALNSGAPQFMKDGYYEAYEFIRETRKGANN